MSEDIASAAASVLVNASAAAVTSMSSDITTLLSIVGIVASGAAIGATVTTHSAYFDSSSADVALIVAVPPAPALAVTKPFASTTATFVSDELHFTVCDAPFGQTVAFSTTQPAGSSETSVLSRVTFSTPEGCGSSPPGRTASRMPFGYVS